MPVNKIFIRCRKCRTPVVSVSLRNKYGDLDIYEVVIAKQDQSADLICGKCLARKPEQDGTVDYLKNLFRMGD